MPTDDLTPGDLTPEEFARVRQGVRLLVAHLVKAEDMPLAGVLASAHAEIIGAIAAVYGGDMAARSARLAADQVEGMPSLEEYAAENPLATMATKGRA
ncbi:hypothetical protein [Tabrizicola sp. YIM 78059]|uniref:hypothetical protein n=1 Tax=Tabrizicola sp. YIM 78059 TaxID=2529861 RepID=UPI0010AA7953|nr:hypothetical protein [Tabrizicola sp. YIM 78059]